MEAFINDAASAAATDADAAAAAHTALTRAALNPITGWGESVLQSAHRTRSSRDPSWALMSRRDPARAHVESDWMDAAGRAADATGLGRSGELTPTEHKHAGLDMEKLGLRDALGKAAEKQKEQELETGWKQGTMLSEKIAEDHSLLLHAPLKDAPAPAKPVNPDDVAEKATKWAESRKHEIELREEKRKKKLEQEEAQEAELVKKHRKVLPKARLEELHARLGTTTARGQPLKRPPKQASPHPFERSMRHYPASPRATPRRQSSPNCTPTHGLDGRPVSESRTPTAADDAERRRAAEEARQRQSAKELERHRARASNPTGRPKAKREARRRKGQPESSTPGAAPSFVSRLTDTTQFTGAHKMRFDATGRGRGIRGRRDSVAPVHDMAAWTRSNLNPDKGSVPAAGPLVLAVVEEGVPPERNGQAPQLDGAQKKKKKRKSPKKKTKPAARKAAAKTKAASATPSFVSRLTDTTQFTGAHKMRFDASGRGRGVRGRRDSVAPVHDMSQFTRTNLNPDKGAVPAAGAVAQPVARAEALSPLDRLKAKMRSLSYTQNGQDPHALFKSFDRDNSGELEMKEFIAAVRKGGAMSKQDISDADLKQIFRAADKDKGGTIGIAELTAFVWGDDDGAPDRLYASALAGLSCSRRCAAVPSCEERHVASKQCPGASRRDDSPREEDGRCEEEKEEEEAAETAGAC